MEDAAGGLSHSGVAAAITVPIIVVAVGGVAAAVTILMMQRLKRRVILGLRVASWDEGDQVADKGGVFVVASPLQIRERDT